MLIQRKWTMYLPG